MDYRLLFTQRALNDLASIIGHIAEDDAEAASRFGTALLDHVDLLTRFPRMGSTIRKRSRVRKLLHSPILVYYQIREDKRLVEVLHVRHGSRKSPAF
ncbi:MAG: type II toxin-antitoxin system RelE/ParE family toxin [Acidobacteriia bacterium]|nr:type II toxin-antitoxin system RelE/ParE family toxin [Terriglobia bacterium]